MGWEGPGLLITQLKSLSPKNLVIKFTEKILKNIGGKILHKDLLMSHIVICTLDTMRKLK